MAYRAVVATEPGSHDEGVRTVTLHWSALRPLAEAAPAAPELPGLYALYGWHPVAGPHTLMLIGRAPESLRARLEEHEAASAHELSPPAVHHAVVAEGTAEGDLADIEALLVSWHAPPYNMMGAAGAPHLRHERWRIYNTGHYAGLVPVVDTSWWSRHAAARAASDGRG